MSSSPSDTTLILRAHGVASGDGSHIVIDRTPFFIGRRPDNDAQVVQSDISGKHAYFELVDNQWYLIDNQSTNGTFLNGDRISDRKSLNLGDVVHFATKGFQLVNELDQDSGGSSISTRILDDSAEIRGMLDLVQIINENRTFPHFQPITDLKSQKCIGWEALGRATTQSGPMPPGTLFRLAEQNKVELKLSYAFRESAKNCAICQYCWPEPDTNYLFFNLHPEEMHDEKMLTSLSELVESGLQKHFKIVIEVPESWVGVTDQMKVFVKKIRERNMLVAYDDFGAGQSRIPDLINVPPDFLKLDRQLVAGLGTHRVKNSIVKAIVEACRELNVRTIGEGIETQDEYDACIAIGIELGQGYFIEFPKTSYELFQIEESDLPIDCVFSQLNLLPGRTSLE